MSGWNDANEITIAANGQVYVADVGASLPTTFATLSASSWFGLGYCTEDGVAVTVTPQVTDTPAWQSNSAVRREVTAQELQAAFALLQWNEESIPLAFGGGAITNSGGVYKYTFPLAGTALDERSLVVDFQDGSRNGRLVIPRGNVTDSVETHFQRTNAAVLPITFKALQPTDGSAIAYILFDDATAFAAGS